MIHLYSFGISSDEHSIEPCVQHQTSKNNQLSFFLIACMICLFDVFFQSFHFLSQMFSAFENCIIHKSATTDGVSTAC